jgi:hypothetical protein
MADAVTINPAAKGRYEAIYKAVGRRSRNAVLLCLAATAAIALIYLMWLAPPMARLLAETGLPRWLTAGLQTGVFLSVAGALPNLAQLIVVRGDTAAAFEAFNAWGLAESERAKRAGTPLRAFRRAEQVQPWLDAHPDAPRPIRIRLLTWGGAIDEARRELAELPIQAPVEAFERALLTYMVDFVATGVGDLRPAGQAIANVPAADYGWARLALALEQARAAHHVGDRWEKPLAVARRDVNVPHAATIAGRFISGWRVYALIVVGGTILSILLVLVL